MHHYQYQKQSANDLDANHQIDDETHNQTQDRNITDDGKKLAYIYE